MSTITRKLLITSATALFALTGAHGAAAGDKHGSRGAGARHHAGATMQHHSVVRHGATGNSRHAGNNRGHHRSGHGGYGGIYIYSGELNGCDHSYRKWQATGSRYWRSRYYECLDS
jgi:hypothetical protein